MVAGTEGKMSFSCTRRLSTSMLMHPHMGQWVLGHGRADVPGGLRGRATSVAPAHVAGTGPNHVRGWRRVEGGRVKVGMRHPCTRRRGGNKREVSFLPFRGRRVPEA